VATSYLLGVSTRRVENLAGSLGVTSLSKSQVSVMAAEFDDMVEGFRFCKGVLGLTAAKVRAPGRPTAGPRVVIAVQARSA
jgi:hypothetical protein